MRGAVSVGLVDRGAEEIAGEVGEGERGFALVVEGVAEEVDLAAGFDAFEGEEDATGFGAEDFQGGFRDEGDAAAGGDKGKKGAELDGVNPLMPDAVGGAPFLDLAGEAVGFGQDEDGFALQFPPGDGGAGGEWMVGREGGEEGFIGPVLEVCATAGAAGGDDGQVEFSRIDQAHEVVGGVFDEVELNGREAFPALGDQ